MKIVAIDTYPLVLPVQEIYGGAAGFLEDCRSLIVRVETENGIEGWGEATQGRPGNTYETLETMEIMAQKYFAPALLKMDLEDTGAVLLKLHRARQGHPITKAPSRWLFMTHWVNSIGCRSVAFSAGLIVGR
jgi:L-alanine-DL-glutamate epimerase-like enolase superfamily enzyme